MPDRNYRPGNQQYPYGQGSGDSGMQGGYGMPGAQGAPGAPGTQAPQGMPGTQGTSGYQGAQSYQQAGYDGVSQGGANARADHPRAKRRGGDAGGSAGVGASTVGVAGAAGSGAAAGAPVKPPKKDLLRRPAVIAGICVVAVALVIALVALLMPKDDFYDGNSIIGQAPYKTTEEIQAELDRKVEEGMLNISIASVIEFEDGQSEGVAYIENVPGNRYVMQVDIALDDTGEQVYQSGGLKPGNYIEKIKLSKDLDAGSYSAIATFHALDPETLDEVGSAAAIVTLNVLS